MAQFMEFNEFKKQFTSYINSNSTSLLCTDDFLDMDWEDYHGSYQSGATFKSIFEAIIEEVYPDGI